MAVGVEDSKGTGLRVLFALLEGFDGVPLDLKIHCFRGTTVRHASTIHLMPKDFDLDIQQVQRPQLRSQKGRGLRIARRGLVIQESSVLSGPKKPLAFYETGV